MKNTSMMAANGAMAPVRGRWFGRCGRIMGGSLLAYGTLGKIQGHYGRLRSSVAIPESEVVRLLAHHYGTAQSLPGREYRCRQPTDGAGGDGYRHGNGIPLVCGGGIGADGGVSAIDACVRQKRVHGRSNFVRVGAGQDGLPAAFAGGVG